VRTAAQVREIAAYADAVIVGSALVGAVADSQDQAAAVEAMRQYAADLRSGTGRG
jgi:tryptophan synthase alpha chain